MIKVERSVRFVRGLGRAGRILPNGHLFCPRPYGQKKTANMGFQVYTRVANTNRRRLSASFCTTQVLVPVQDLTICELILQEISELRWGEELTGNYAYEDWDSMWFHHTFGRDWACHS